MSNHHPLTYEEIQTATKSFDSSQMVSNDLSGKVYIGDFIRHEDPFKAFAKILHIEGSEEDWVEHVEYLTKLKHARLAELFGYCYEENRRILVYCHQKGSLKSMLSHNAPEQLSWAKRFRIAKGASNGLKFLLKHKKGQRPINSHCVNTSNILIAADDGKAMLTVHFHPGNGGDNVEEVLYNYGLVLLEILTATSLNGDSDLIEWIDHRPRNPKDILHVMDKRLEGQYSKFTATTAATLAFKCLGMVQSDIKTMARVRKELIVLKKFDVAFRASKTSTVNHIYEE